jgi:hypothetical protein
MSVGGFMKTLRWSVLLALVAMSSCDRSVDEMSPDPIAPGKSGPGTAYQAMAKAGIPIGSPADAAGADAAVTEDAAGTDTALTDGGGETAGCTGSEAFCTCLGEFQNNTKYDDYCNCMISPEHSTDGGIYCNCCYFGYDESFPEHAEWGQYVLDLCDPQGYMPPCD